MAQRDFVPKTDGNLLAWHDNFRTQFSTTALTLGFAAADVTAVNTDNTNLHTVHGNAVTLRAAAQAATATKNDTFSQVIARIRAFANRIKSHPSFTTALGEQLGIVGPESVPILASAKPELEGRIVEPGHVLISFVKGDSSGVKLWSRRGSESGFSFLAVDTESPYLDNRQNLGAGPETRQYQAQYLDGDDLTGVLSDIITVTVPGV